MNKPDVLGKFYLFRDAAADDLIAVEALVRERYAPSQLIFREGDDAQSGRPAVNAHAQGIASPAA